ncbi:hypothetical protein LSAT2_028657 [Lamellibrachia satsuma]|nr:hypothetical protein LSAT2_028657 [Lamellibrachia satsuma]
MTPLRPHPTYGCIRKPSHVRIFHDLSAGVVMGITTILLLATFALAAAGERMKINYQAKEFTELGKGCGRAKPCHGSRQNFTLEFCPTVLTIRKPLQMSFVFTPRVAYKEGKVCYTVYFDQPNESDPVHQSCQPLHCDRINKLFPTMCPFRKGVTSKGTEVLDFKEFATYIPPHRQAFTRSHKDNEHH